MEKENKQKDSLQEKAVLDIYHKYKSPLRGFITKRVPSKEDSEDILQNVFYQLSKIDLVENPITHISAWLYSVARNLIIDRSRKRKEEEMPYISDRDDETTLSREITDTLLSMNSRESDFIKTLIWDELGAALEELPQEQRDIFELTELEGFSFKEIADLTGITVNTLISRKRYAVLHLRKRLFEVYEEFLGE